MKIWWLFIGVLLNNIGFAEADELRVAVAANFKPVLTTLADQFEKSSGHSVSLSSAASGALYIQIANGAPFDLFLSADRLRPEKLEKEGLTLDGSRKTYAYGELVLWSQDRQVKTLADLAPYKGRLAMANPVTAPYGVAAEEVLKKKGLWSRFQGRIVQGASIQQAWQFVVSGNVPVGLVARSQLMDSQYEKETVFVIPVNLYQPIQQDMVILKRSKNPNLAQQFSDFLMSGSSQTYITSRGYRELKH